MNQNIKLNYFHLKDKIEVDDLIKVKEIVVKIKNLFSEHAEISGFTSKVIETRMINVTGSFVWETEIPEKEFIWFNDKLQFDLFIKYEDPKDFKGEVVGNLTGFLDLKKVNFGSLNITDISILKIDPENIKVSAFKKNDDKLNNPYPDLLIYFLSLNDAEKFNMLLDKLSLIDLSLEIMQNIYNQAKFGKFYILENCGKFKKILLILNLIFIYFNSLFFNLISFDIQKCRKN